MRSDNKLAAKNMSPASPQNDVINPPLYEIHQVYRNIIVQYLKENIRPIKM